MENHTRALEVVCKHFRNECGDALIASLRNRINRAHVANCRLRKKLNLLEEHLHRQTSCRQVLDQILILLINRMDLLLSSEMDRVLDV